MHVSRFSGYRKTSNVVDHVLLYGESRLLVHHGNTGLSENSEEHPSLRLW